MNNKFPDLKNKNIIITGGNGFFGKQITNAFYNQGSNVFILDTKKSREKKRITFFKTDITKEFDIKKVLIFFKKKN